jgi:hypothetical protein
MVGERAIARDGGQLLPDRRRGGFVPARGQAGDLADDADLIGPGHGLRASQDVARARMLAVGQDPDRDIGDVTFVDE